jgi:hypothetical protein
MKLPALIADTFASNALQSVGESAPVVVADASPSESSCPERVSPFVVPRVIASCAWAWSRATWDCRIVTLPERVERFVFIILTAPESDARLVLVAKIAPERVLKLLVTRVERFERSPERVFTLFEIPVTVVVRFVRDPERFVISVVLRSTCPERVPTVAARVARDPETAVIVVLRVFTVPESVVTIFVRFERLVLVVARDPERFAILVLFWVTTPESEVRFAFVVASTPDSVVTVALRFERFVETIVICEFRADTLPERAFCARVSVK